MSIIPSQTRIHKIIDSNQFNFYCFKEKFGNEFIAIFLYGDAFTAEVIRCFNESIKDKTRIETFLNFDSWFPFVKGKTPLEAYTRLCEKLNELSNDDWENAWVHGMMTVRRAYRIPDNKRLASIPLIIPKHITDLTVFPIS